MFICSYEKLTILLNIYVDHIKVVYFTLYEGIIIYITLDRSQENLENEKKIIEKFSQKMTINYTWIFSEFLVNAF